MARLARKVRKIKKFDRVLFTCGGTAGHVNPALALARLIREENPGAKFLFVGADRGLERDLITKAGYDFKSVHISSFHRSFQPKEIRHNMISVLNLFRSPREAKAILREFQPDAVIGTGGYASYPAVKAAYQMGIPTAVHESNMVPGLATKLLEPYADCIMTGFEAARDGYKHPDKIIITGTPVRGDFFIRTKREAKRELNLDENKPLIVSFWGSLGASGMNRVMADFIALEAKKTPFYHMHAAGKDGYPMILNLLKQKNIDLKSNPDIKILEYIYNMPVVMRAADLVISRAGASTISELTALGVPAVLVPSPFVTNHHQEKNAKALETAGGAAVLSEETCTGQLLFQTAAGVLHDKDQYIQMQRAMASLGIPDAAERILYAVRNIGNEAESIAK